jgi:hypothetical protein
VGPVPSFQLVNFLYACEKSVITFEKWWLIVEAVVGPSLLCQAHPPSCFGTFARTNFLSGCCQDIFFI